MNINEQELSEAVDKLWEGDDNDLLVKQDEVFNSLMGNKIFISNMFDSVISGICPKEYFKAKFQVAAERLLTEALRTHKEQQEGLM